MLLLVPSRLELDRLVPEADAAARHWSWPTRRDGDGEPIVVARCGVGVALSGIRTAVLLAETNARSVLLAGLAGSLDSSAAPLGCVLVGADVAVHGVGVGEGRAHLSLASAGGALAEEAASAAGALALHQPPGLSGLRAPLLTVCAASGDADEAEDRKRRHPAALAEDMESWAVARAATEAGLPCIVLRAVSNLAGQREPGTWQTDEAFRGLRAAIDALTGEAP